MTDEETVESDSPLRSELHFGPYRLAGPQGPLWAADAVINLPRKPLALLWTLANRAGEVVTKDELLAIVWPRMVVTEGVISASLRDLRRALGDDARRPRFIATAHRIGYRFIAEVNDHPAAATSRGRPPDVATREDPEPAPVRDTMVGRDAERKLLQGALTRALGGERQVVFVTGEAGIGKSRLVDGFVSSLQRPEQSPNDLAGVRVGHGQCIEHYGSGEPYMPVLEAVTRLCRQPGGRPLLALLRLHAPTWLAQMPGLIDHEEHIALQRQSGANPVQRMLREMAEAIDAVAADNLLVLVFEDMHWSDSSTVDWLVMLARRRERARLLVLATCRPVELIVSRHPLKRAKQELLTRSAAQEINLSYLTANDVQAYMAQRMRDTPITRDLAATVFRRSQGHPLFMVHMADDLRLANTLPVVDDRSLPGGVRDLIDAQLERLAPEHLAVLEAASVSGSEFAAASVAAGLQRATEEIERVLETLTLHEQFIEARGLAEWHDGTVSGRYGFRHDLYRDRLYRRLGAARRVRLHALIGERLSAAYGAYATEVAAELALHFESAKDAKRAAHFCREAGEKALQRYAYREALALTCKGLALLATQAAVPDRDTVELRLLLTQGAALLATRGYAAPEVESTYTRALALGISLNDSEAIGPALSGLYNLYLTRAAFARVREIADQVLTIVNRRPDPVLSMLAHNVRGSALLFAGEPAAALEHVDQTLSLYDVHAHRLLAATYCEDPAMACHHYAALARWITGFSETAARHLTDGFALARLLAHPFGKAQMLWMETVISLDDGDLQRADRASLSLTALCAEHEFSLWLAGGQILRGGVLAARGNPAEGALLTDRGLRAWRGAGTLLTMPHALAIAARVQAISGRIDKSLLLVAEAIATARRTGERWYESELHRLQGEMILALPEAADAETQRAQASFECAIDLARLQQARLLELRASVSLASLWLQQARPVEARALLMRASAGFTEGLNGRDLKRAATLLAHTSAR